MPRTASQITATLRAQRGPQVERDPHAYAEPLTRASAGRAHLARGAHARRSTEAVARFLALIEAR